MSLTVPGDSRPLKVLFLPPSRQLAQAEKFVPGSAPDPNEFHNALAQEWIHATTMEPFSWPINPFSGKHSLREWIDPVRALNVLRDGRNFDLIVSVMEGAALVPLALRRLAGMRAPIVLWDIGLTPGWRLRSAVLDFVVPRAEAIFVLCASQKIYVEGRWPITGTVELVSHRVDSSFFHPLPETLSNRVISIGEDGGRDFETLLAAAKRVSAPFIVKTRLHQEKVLSAAIENVTVLSDWLSFAELRKFYADCAIVAVPLLPSINASGVTTILEASAMGKALVVTDSQSIRDFIIPDQTCLTVPSGDGEALAAAINRLLADPPLRRALGAKARDFVQAEFSSRALAARVAPVMRRLARAG